VKNILFIMTDDHTVARVHRQRRRGLIDTIDASKPAPPPFSD
jgi:hypothetical protein